MKDREQGLGMREQKAMNPLKDWIYRLRTSIGWIAAQFWATLLIVLAGVGWTRLPDRHVWQVGLSILLPLALLAATLLLEAGTMRKLSGQEQGRVGMAQGALTLLVWAAIAWFAWLLLNWCDDRVILWAGYLNSRAPAHLRAALFSYQHLSTCITLLIWALRWIVLPAKLIPLALASAQWGWRLPCLKLVCLLLNWRWWLAALVAALAGVVLPGQLFAGLPHGSTSHQVWAVVFETAGAFLLPIFCWVLLLSLGATLLSRQAEPAEDALDRQLLARFHAGRIWITGLAVWTFLSFLSDVLTDHLPDSLKSSGWIIIPIILVLAVSLVFLQVLLMRSMIGPDEKRASVVSGTLMPLAWALPGVVILVVSAAPDFPGYLEVLCWVLVSGLLIPFLAASAQWGVRLPWRRVVRILYEWRWWLGIVAAVIVGVAIPDLFLPDYGSGVDPRQTDIYRLRRALCYVLEWGSWVYLMGWYAVLLARKRPGPKSPGDDALVPAPVHSGPLREDSVKLPLPDSGGDSSGKA